MWWESHHRTNDKSNPTKCCGELQILCRIPSLLISRVSPLGFISSFVTTKTRYNPLLMLILSTDRRNDETSMLLPVMLRYCRIHINHKQIYSLTLNTLAAFLLHQIVAVKTGDQTQLKIAEKATNKAAMCRHTLYVAPSVEPFTIHSVADSFLEATVA